MEEEVSKSLSLSKKKKVQLLWELCRLHRDGETERRWRGSSSTISSSPDNESLSE